jgi:hypothetical protein
MNFAAALERTCMYATLDLTLESLKRVVRDLAVLRNMNSHYIFRIEV